MARLTKPCGSDRYYLEEDIAVQHDENGYTGDAIRKLALFENAYEDLIKKQAKIAEELEKLRSEEKMHTVKFKQLLTEKLTVSNILILLKSYGL